MGSCSLTQPLPSPLQYCEADMSDALAVIRQLRTEAATAEAFELALSTVATLVHNVLAHPEDAKFRIVRLANATFHARLGQYLAGLSLLRSFGFEDAFQGADKGEQPTHLAIAEVDAGQLAQCLVLVEAARLASRHVAGEEEEEQQRPAGAPSNAGHVLPGGAAASSVSRSSGKRPIAAVTASTEPSGKHTRLNFHLPKQNSAWYASQMARSKQSPLR